MALTQSLTLNNGIQMPILGLGVYKSAEHTKASVLAALEAGYRHIDTAAFYMNEKEVGEAIRESGIPREEIFITTKLWNDDQRNGCQREAFEKSMELLGLDYLDLYLIHWPVKDCFVKSWNIMEEYQQAGRIRSIGVSNFHMQHLMELMAHSKTVPVINQVECHPYLSQQPLRSFCNKLGIQVTAWAPLGRTNVFGDPVIQELAAKYGKTPAQIILRWEIQNNIIVIPKSVHKERIISNSQIFDFELAAEDMAMMNALNKNERYGSNPDNFEF